MTKLMTSFRDLVIAPTNVTTLRERVCLLGDLVIIKVFLRRPIERGRNGILTIAGYVAVNVNYTFLVCLEYIYFLYFLLLYHQSYYRL